MSYQTIIKELPVVKCGFAPSGTYGHECGEPAVSVAVFTGVDSNNWQDGIFYSGRCAKCATILGGENAGGKIEPLYGHVNRLVTHRWLPDEVSA